MADFGIRFFLCNILICAVTGILLITKRALKNHLTCRIQFNLWFLLLGLLAVPFLPVRPAQFPQIFSWLENFKKAASPNIESAAQTAEKLNTPGAAKQIHDFALSVSSKTPSVIGLILFGMWLIGIFAMLLLAAKSRARLNSVKKSALPLQNREIRKLYDNCLREMKIKRNLPIYSTAFLKSPIIAGLFRPCIYLPIHLISDYHIYAERHKGYFNAADMQHTRRSSLNACPSETNRLRPIRYMLLHELQHYKHGDAITSCLMNLIGILYWFNPFVWYALKEMRDDREIACDISVLNLLNESDYEDYGNTLINFAEKVSLTPFPFAAGISGTMKQMQKRIIRISSYQKPSAWKKIKGIGIFVLILVIFLGLTPMLSTYAAEQNYYAWNIAPEKVTLLSSHDIDGYPKSVDLLDLSAYFHGYEGSFVLYDLKNDAWSVYDMDHATLRTAPDSTYKIYDALFGLEEGIITPEDSFMAWNGDSYPFEAWNTDQNLNSAMQDSVNWYFQEIDRQLGASAIRSYLKEIGYGNENIDTGVSSYWMQGTLKISPVEQVELLTALHNNSFGFAPENVNAVKKSICLFSSSLPDSSAIAGAASGTEGYPQSISLESKNFYGKTGTGRVDGQDVNGWFVGYIETTSNTYFFATNIQAAENATGSKASEISLSILSHIGIWQQ